MGEPLFQSGDITTQLPPQLVSADVCCVRAAGAYVYVLRRLPDSGFALAVLEAATAVTVRALATQQLRAVGSLDFSTRLPCASLHPSEAGLYAVLCFYDPEGGDVESYVVSPAPKFNKLVRRPLKGLRERVLACASQPAVSSFYRAASAQVDALDGRSAEFLALTASGGVWACQVERKEVQVKSLASLGAGARGGSSLARTCRDYFSSGYLYVFNVNLATVAAQVEANLPGVFGAANNTMFRALQKVSGLISRANFSLVVIAVGVEIFVYLERADSLFNLRLDEGTRLRHIMFPEYLVDLPGSGASASAGGDEDVQGDPRGDAEVGSQIPVVQPRARPGKRALGKGAQDSPAGAPSGAPSGDPAGKAAGKAAKPSRPSKLLPLSFASFLSVSKQTGVTIEVCYQPAASKPISVVLLRLSFGKILETIVKSHCLRAQGRRDNGIIDDNDAATLSAFLQMIEAESFRSLVWDKAHIRGVSDSVRVIGGPGSPNLPGLQGLSGVTGPGTTDQVFIGALPFGWHTLYITNTRVYVCNHISGAVVESLAFLQGPEASALLQSLGVLKVARDAADAEDAEGKTYSAAPPSREVVLALRNFLASQLPFSPLLSFSPLPTRRADYSGVSARETRDWLPLLPGTLLWPPRAARAALDPAAFVFESANEARDLWKVYLKERKYDLALENCRSEPDLKRIREEYAAVCLRDGRDTMAAQLYAQTDLSIFKVCQDLLSEDRHRTAIEYLEQKIPTLPRPAEPRSPQGDGVTIEVKQAYEEALAAYSEAKKTRTLAAHLYLEIITLEISTLRSRIDELSKPTAMRSMRAEIGAAECVLDAEAYFSRRGDRAGYDLGAGESAGEAPAAVEAGSDPKAASLPSVMDLQDDLDLYRDRIITAFSDPEIAPYLSPPVVKNTLGLYDLGDEYVAYCKKNRDFRSVLDYQIRKRQFTPAIDTLKSFSDDGVYYYANVFLREIPYSFLELVKERLFRKDSTFCVQNIVQAVWEAANDTPRCRSYVCSFLRWVLVDLCCSDANVSIFAIEFLAYYDNDEGFLVDLLQNPQVQERAGVPPPEQPDEPRPASIRGRPGEPAQFDVRAVLAISHRLGLTRLESVCQKLCGNSERSVLLNLSLLRNVKVSELDLGALPSEEELGFDGAGGEAPGEEARELDLPQEHEEVSKAIRDLIADAPNSMTRTRLSTIYMRWLCELGLENDAGMPTREFEALSRRFGAACVWRAASFLQDAGDLTFAMFMEALPGDTGVSSVWLSVQRIFQSIVGFKATTRKNMDSVCTILSDRRREEASSRNYALQFDSGKLLSVGPSDSRRGAQPAPTCCCCGQSLAALAPQAPGPGPAAGERGKAALDSIFPSALLVYPCGHIAHFGCMLERVRASSYTARPMQRMINAYCEGKERYRQACSKEGSSSLLSIFTVKQTNAELEAQRAAVMNQGEALMENLSRECQLCSLRSVEEIFARLPSASIKVP